MASGTTAPSRPDPFNEAFLQPNETKVEISIEKKVRNCVVLEIKKEGHTLGALLAIQLINDPDLVFAAYNVPHPLESRVLLRIQADPETTPFHAFQNACLALDATFANLKQQISSYDV